MTGLVFNIQRFSVNDGPGIRTTVFFKGCPLHCRWCHNPESISSKKEIILREDHCIRCGSCVRLCRENAVSERDGKFSTVRAVCTACGDCVRECYADAREIVGKEMSVEEVMREVVKDRVFFDESGGGVSFSGGEPLLQHVFLLELLKASKAAGLHTVLDTTGFTTPTILGQCAPWVDLFLYDIKTLDDDRHKLYTGVSNRLILDNLQMLVDRHAEIIIRVPIIPGVNDNGDDIVKVGTFVSGLGGIREVQLLPYHQTGLDKYRRLGLDYQLSHTIPPTHERMHEIADELGKRFEFVSVGV